jgi:hypothetical protein
MVAGEADVLQRWTRRFVLVGMAGALALPAAPAHAQSAGIYGPGSLARIRAALEAPPPRLQVPPTPPDGVPPTFRVEVNQYFSVVTPPEDEPFDLTWGLPSAGELMMSGIGKVGAAVSGYKKRRARGKAKQEVADALADFCAVNSCPAPATR